MALRSMSARAAAPVLAPKFVRTTSSSPTIATHSLDKPGAFLAWQQRLKPQLANLSPDALSLALLEVENKWLPLLPEKDFMDAWLDASKPVMAKMHLKVWVRALNLGAKPDKDFVLQLAVAATDEVLRSYDSLPFTFLHTMCLWGATLETLGPLFEESEKLVLAQLRSQNARCLFTKAPEAFQQAGYVPSSEFCAVMGCQCVAGIVTGQ